LTLKLFSNVAGVDRRGENLQMEFWLVTAFHERGSLCDHLKLNTLSLDELCRISLGIAAGLTHLHTEIPAGRDAAIKPAIAHRDFKSKNVLIKSDMTACIGDFGLALQFKPNEIVGDTHGQVSQGSQKWQVHTV
jgi:serine/threonine protein kinase